MICKVTYCTKPQILLGTLLLTSSVLVLSAFQTRTAEERALNVPPTENVQVAKDEFDCMRLKFQESFKLKFGTVLANIPVVEQPFTVASYKVARDVVNCATGQQKGFVVHYGLDKNMVFVPQFSFVCLTEVGTTGTYEYDLDDSQFFTVVQGELVPSTLDAAAWYNTDGPWTRYKSNVWVKRQDGGVPAHCTDSDVRHVVHPAARMDAIVADNGLDGESLAVFSFAEPKNRMSGEDQGILHLSCISGWANGSPVVDDKPSPPDAPFLGKASDLGSACPPNCAQAAFSLKGITAKGCGSQ